MLKVARQNSKKIILHRINKRFLYLSIAVGKSHSKKRIEKMSFVQFQEVFLEYLADSCHLDVEGWSSNAIINQFPTIFIILIKHSLSQQDYKLGAKFSTPSFTSSLSALMAMSLSSLIKLFSTSQC